MAEPPCEQKILASAVAHLDLVVLVRPRSTEAFRLVGSTPTWFTKIFGGIEKFPTPSLFLTAFIEGPANDCWQGELSEVKSGYWEESNDQEQSHFFKATALQDGDQDLLILALSDEDHHQEQRYLQHAHDVALHQRRLAKERERKEILLDCIVHELSKPLSTILMNLQFVQAQLDREDLLKALARAETQAEVQRDLIHSISHTFDSELSDFEPSLLAQKEGTSLSALITEAIESLHPLAQEQGVTIQSGGLLSSYYVIAEKGHLLRILENLLEQAIRRTPRHGTVSIFVETRNRLIRTTISNQSIEQREDPTHRQETDLTHHFCKMAITRWGGRLQEENDCSWFELQEHPADSSSAQDLPSCS